MRSKNLLVSVMRLAVFIPLLIGLLFSRGEGITLLPFPDIATRPYNRGVQPSSPSNDERIEIDKNETSGQAKLRARDVVQHGDGCGAVDFCWCGDYAFTADPELFYEYPIALITAIPTSVTGRAPPISES